VGLVVEQPKCSTEDHHLRWYCRRCNAIVYDEAFQPTDLGKQIKAITQQFKGTEALRKCRQCGTIHDV
jgi:3-hydroxyanthranilate 3,4-dioxygenase